MEVYIPRCRFQVSCVLVCVCKVERDASAVRPKFTVTKRILSFVSYLVVGKDVGAQET